MQITYTCLECGKEINDGGRIYCAQCQAERESANAQRQERTIRRIIKEGVAYDEAEIYCPHCGEVYEIDAASEEHILEQGTNKLTCYACGKPFTVSTYIFRSFTTHKVEYNN